LWSGADFDVLGRRWIASIPMPSPMRFPDALHQPRDMAAPAGKPSRSNMPRNIQAPANGCSAIHPRTKVQGVLDEKHGFIWCFGASLSRLLPVIEINEDFKKFFNNPNRAMLTNLRSFIFSAMGIVGWIPGAILIAAVSGLTQSS
jgi:hypothetical protein